MRGKAKILCLGVLFLLLVTSSSATVFLKTPSVSIANEPYLFILQSTIYFNDTKLNQTIDARVGASSSKKGQNPWLTNDTEFIIFNESHYNTTKGEGVDTNESIRVHNISIFLQNLTVANCGSGKKMVGVATNGSIECEDDIDTQVEDTDTVWSLDDNWLHNVSTVLSFNESKHNESLIPFNDTALCLEINSSIWLQLNTHNSSLSDLQTTIIEVNSSLWTQINVHNSSLGDLQSTLIEVNTTAWEQITVHNTSLSSLASSLNSVNATVQANNLTQATQISTHNSSLSDLQTEMTANNNTLGNLPITCGADDFISSIDPSLNTACTTPAYTVDTNESERVKVHNASLISLRNGLNNLNSTTVADNTTQSSQLSTHNSSLVSLRNGLNSVNGTVYANNNTLANLPITCSGDDFISSIDASLNTACTTPAYTVDTNESNRVGNFAPFTCGGSTFIYQFAADGTPTCGSPSIPFTYSFQYIYGSDGGSDYVKADTSTDRMSLESDEYIDVECSETGGPRTEFCNITIQDSAPERCHLFACGENAAIDNGQYEWSCGGNGESGSALNLYPMFNGTIRGIAMTCNSAPSNARVNMTLDNAWTNCSVSYTGGPDITSCAVPFTSSQGMQPRTDWDLGNSQCVVSFKLCQDW